MDTLKKNFEFKRVLSRGKCINGKFLAIYIFPNKLNRLRVGFAIGKKAGKAHELSEGDTMYLGACRKGQKGDALRKQPYSTEMAVGRAFSLKPAYMRVVLEWALKTGKNHLNTIQPELSSLVSSEDLQTKSFEEIVLNRFEPYLGLNYNTIASALHVDISNNPKNKFAMIASAIACQGRAFNVNMTEEFLKAGLMMKTIRVQANGNIKEAMAFENIDYQEVYDNLFEKPK